MDKGSNSGVQVPLSGSPPPDIPRAFEPVRRGLKRHVKVAARFGVRQLSRLKFPHVEWEESGWLGGWLSGWDEWVGIPIPLSVCQQTRCSRNRAS